MEPLSTSTWLMVWHWLLLPGSQMVTLVYSLLTLLPVGPRSTVTAMALLPAGTSTVGSLAGALLPPPQAAIETDSSVTAIHRPKPLSEQLMDIDTVGHQRGYIGVARKVTHPAA